MRFNFLLALVFTFPMLKYDKKDHHVIESQDKEKESEKALTTLREQMKDIKNLTVPLQPQFQKFQDERQLHINVKSQKEVNKQKLQAVEKNYTTQNQDRLFFKPAFTALNLDTAFFLLLIHTCGADLVQSISTVSQHMWSVVGLVELAFSFILAVYAKYKWKREKADLQRENTFLQNQSQKMEKERDDTVAALQEQREEHKKQRQKHEKQREELKKQRQKHEKQREEHKKQREEHKKQREELKKHREELKKQREELGEQRRRLGEQLEENEREREENKQKLQSVEREITEREKMFDKPQELLRKKENLLQAQWKLDETKKFLEKQILDREKLLDTTEILLPRINRQSDA